MQKKIQQKHKKNAPLENTTKTGVYCRVSTKGQNIDIQIDECIKFALKRFNESKPVIYAEKLSGYKNESRPKFELMRKDMINGKVDIIITYDLSRLTRSGVGQTIEFIQWAVDNNVSVYSVKEGLDFTANEMSMVMASMLACFARLEYEYRREKQAAGIAYAKAKGKKWGGSKRIRDKKNDHAVLTLRQGEHTIRDISDRLNISTRTVQKIVNLFVKEGKLKPGRIRN